MAQDKGKDWKGPVFLLADDDRSAADAITGKLYPECYYIVQVTNPRHVRSYAKRLAPRAIFLAEPLEYAKGGAEALLRRLTADLQIPVIILSELWSPQVAEVWKSKGATHCLPHPTRHDQRLDLLRSAMQELALDTVPRIPEGQ